MHTHIFWQPKTNNRNHLIDIFEENKRNVYLLLLNYVVAHRKSILCQIENIIASFPSPYGSAAFIDSHNWIIKQNINVVIISLYYS